MTSRLDRLFGRSSRSNKRAETAPRSQSTQRVKTPAVERTRDETPIAYGIDFGTTNSQIAGAFADRVKVVPVEKGELEENLPSIIYLHRNAQRSAGTEAVNQYLLTGRDRTACRGCEFVTWTRHGADTACKQFRQAGGCNDSRLLAGIKSSLADRYFDQTHSWGVDFLAPELVAVVLSRLKRDADQYFDADVRRVVLGHPVVFAGAEGKGAGANQRRAEERIAEAAGIAGFDEVDLFPEPSAALEDDVFRSGTILAADFGGGTFDAAVIRAPRLPGEVAGLAGTPVGGEDLDAVIFDAMVAPAIGLGGDYRDSKGRQHHLPARFAARLRRIDGLRAVLNDPDFGSSIREFQKYQGGEQLAILEEIIYGGFAYDFYRAIEQAKIDLSLNSDASIRLERGRTLDLDIAVSRAEFEKLIAPQIKAIENTICKALDQAEMTAQDVDVVVRTGGSSLIPAFQTMLDDMFGADKIQERGPFTAIAVGLARRAQQVWA